ncbi:MAG: hypothetical protein GWO07_11265 [Candidatus Dadabacteria bacterium]|nr:hypothetical protein [Candidatus Dadabacteria bacterium]NIV42126.1 hypothetical protein [Candidatus Dadabacteria bacterium]NIX15859.1 hypothetical protein [Candidatus Dadabacteria bacterium]
MTRIAKKLAILTLLLLGLGFSASANAQTNKSNVFGVDIENRNIDVCMNIKDENAEKLDDKFCLKDDTNAPIDGIIIDKRINKTDIKKFYAV